MDDDGQTMGIRCPIKSNSVLPLLCPPPRNSALTPLSHPLPRLLCLTFYHLLIVASSPVLFPFSHIFLCSYLIVVILCSLVLSLSLSHLAHCTLLVLLLSSYSSRCHPCPLLAAFSPRCLRKLDDREPQAREECTTKEKVCRQRL